MYHGFVCCKDKGSISNVGNTPDQNVLYLVFEVIMRELEI